MSHNELKGPDAFQRLTLKVTEGAALYSGAIVAVLALLVAGGIGWTTWNWMSTRKEEKAQAALYLAEREFLKKRETYERADLIKSLGADQKKAPKLPEGAGEPSGDLEKDYGPEIKALTEITDQFSGTRAAALAALEMAEVLHKYKQSARGIELLEKAEKSLPAKELLYSAVLMKLAGLESSDNKCEAAVTHYQKLLSNKQHAYFHAEASLRSALCYEELKNVDKARELYQQTYERYPTTNAGKSAQMYLLLLNSQG